jgi:ABC-type multidrug transport system ATPase subunit
MTLKYDNLVIGYNQQLVLIKNVKLNLQMGDLILILGDNGVGKSTLQKTLLGFIESLNSSVINLEKEYVSYCSPESYGLIDELTGRENLIFFSESELNLDDYFKSFFAISFFNEVLNLKVANQSSGMKALLKLLISILPEKIYVFWDEPLRSLSENTKIEFLKSLENFKKDKIFIITDHEDTDWKSVKPQKYLIKDKELIRI